MSHPNVPIVNAAYLDIQGLHLAWVDGTHITVDLGQTRNNSANSNTNDIIISAQLSVNAAVNGANGLDTGALANSTLYAVYAIGDSSQNNPGAAILSTNFAGPLLPMGYDMYRRIGAVLTSGAAAILDFSQKGNTTNRSMWYGAAVATNIVAGAAVAFTAVDCSASVPSTGREVYLKSVLTADAGATRTAAFRSHDSSSAAGQAFTSSPASTVTTASIICPCMGTPATAIDYIVSNAAAAIAISISGYLDIL